EHWGCLAAERRQRPGPALRLYVMEASVTYRIARELGQPGVREFYADRDYGRNGSIVFTRRAGRLDPRQVADKVLRACVDGRVATVDGEDIDIDFDSICLHSDTPGALALARATRDALTAHGIRIAAPATAEANGIRIDEA
ncbi:lactam utilization protein LamB, partial [Burkholderia pseudomallei]